MKPFETKKYIVKLLDHNNKDELIELQRLRYDYLLRDFDPSLPEGGLDDDGFDDYTDSILVIDRESGRIAGTYRVATLKTMKGKEFKCEEEFDITNVKNDPDGMVETGRAVVNPDFRDGAVINLLWKGLMDYTLQNNCRYIIGTASLHGTKPEIFDKCTTYIRRNAMNTKMNVFAKKNAFEFADTECGTLQTSDIPNLLKTYLFLGATISVNGYIDYEFNSSDVMIIIDVQNMNQRAVQLLMRV